MSILVTGGTGFIGSHTCVELLECGMNVIIVDNLINSKIAVLDRIRQITGKVPKFYQVDLLDSEALSKVFDENQIDAVIHFAGLKAVGESCKIPLRYYQNNLIGTMNLLECMSAHSVKRIVFSSSACVYGEFAHSPCKETDQTGSTNPYGCTKLFIERMLTDIQSANPDWSVILLRYFNPIGAHPSGLLGEDPQGIPNNLIPYVARVAIGKLPLLNIFGNDYNTPDGTCIRDYIHVVDLAKGHVNAIQYCLKNTVAEAINLGTGKGISVLEVVKSFEKASGVNLNYKIVGRRAGDVEVLYSDPTKAKELLGWEAKLDIDQMCKDTWNFIQKNPNGI